MFEYLKNIIESYRSRLSNPILGTYTLSFILCNWRPLLILISSKSSIEENIKEIDAKYSFLGSVLWPILITIIVVLIVPYLMMALEYAVLKSATYRKKLKNSSVKADYTHKIEIASLEFEIQNKKSGTRTIEMMQSNVDLLESEKQSLINQISQQKDAHQIELTSFEELLHVEKQKNANKINSNIIEFSASVFDTYNSLEMSGRLEEFIFSYDYFGKYLGKDKLINFYDDLGLMVRKDGVYTYNSVADELYTLIFELSNQKDQKRKIRSIVDKFNKHEISSIQNVTKNSPFLNIDGFNQPLTMQLSEQDFIDVSLDGNNTLTESGWELRNIMGIVIFEK